MIPSLDKLAVNSDNDSNLNIDEDETNLSLQNQKHAQLNLFLNELITFVIKKHDEGIEFDRIKSVIIQQINQNTSEFIKLLSQNQNESQHIWFFGLFYHYGIGIDKDSNKALEL